MYHSINKLNENGEHNPIEILNRILSQTIIMTNITCPRLLRTSKQVLDTVSCSTSVDEMTMFILGGGRTVADVMSVVEAPAFSSDGEASSSSAS